MKDDTKSNALERRASFLLSIAERAKHLSEEVGFLASAVEDVEDAREELADILDDEDSTEAEKDAARAFLAKKEANLARRRERADILEAHLSNFKDDVQGCLGVELQALTNL
jgi:hypothetical protein